MTHYEKALNYLRKNHTWSEAEEAAALERIDHQRCSLDYAAPAIAEAIADLLEEYGQDNDLLEGWWMEYGTAEDYFFEMEPTPTEPQPACLNEKDVTTDWIEDIFDCQRAVMVSTEALGFIKGVPFRAKWATDNNALLWQAIRPAGSDVFAELEARLKNFESDDTPLYSERHLNGSTLFQYFFTK